MIVDKPNLHILEPFSSWEELDKQLHSLDSRAKGDWFELFCKALLITNRQFNAKAVYLGSEIPPEERTALKLPFHDLGQDGLLIKNDGTRVVFQAKYRSDKTLTHTELSTFFSVAEHADERLLIRTTGLSPQAQKVIDLKDNTYQIDCEYLLELTKEECEKIYAYMTKKSYGETKPRALWPIQQKAIDDLLALSDTESAPKRATCVMPCGTGKTLVAIRYAEKIKAKRIVVLLPSLLLVEQTMKGWCFDSTIPTESFSYHVICSDTGKDNTKDNDQIIIPKSALSFVRSTEPDAVRTYLDKNKDKHQILFCTYQSTRVLIDSLKAENLRCDLIIFDEAHRTAGKVDSDFSLALDNKNLDAKHRLFLTATPKHFNCLAKNKAGEDKIVFSMDDEKIYGKKALIDYREAIENERICDYKVIVSVVTADDLTRDDIRQADVHSAGRPEQSTDGVSAAHDLAITQAMEKHDIKKIISFHRRIKEAKEFAEQPSHLRSTKLGGASQYIKGSHGRQERTEILSTFKNAEHGLLSNARCLTEGINIPSVDCVAFLSPKRSRVDIIQAVGRAMRKDPSNKAKKTGYILLPILIKEKSGESLEDAAAASNYDEVWDVLNSLKEHDPILANILKKVAEKKGRAWTYNPLEDLKDHIEIIGTSICSEKLKNSIGIKVVDHILESWSVRYGQLLDYKEKEGDCNVPANYKDNRSLGKWCNTQRTMKKKDKLAQDKIDQLNEIGFVWDQLEAAWREQFAALKAFKEKEGDCNVPYNYKDNPSLGLWCSQQRHWKKKGKLDQRRINLLEGIGFVWDQLEAAWKEQLDELKAFKKENDHCNVPANYKDNPSLAEWCNTQRKMKKKDKLDQDKINQLHEIGFVWDQLEAAWKEQFDALKAFKEKKRHCNVPYRYKDNPSLGKWCGTQRQMKQKGKLAHDKFVQLHEIGFVWDQLEAAWKEQFDALKAFKEKNRHCNVPYRYKDNPSLGLWCARQRKMKKKDKLDQDKFVQLHEIGFVWSFK